MILADSQRFVPGDVVVRRASLAVRPIDGGRPTPTPVVDGVEATAFPYGSPAFDARQDFGEGKEEQGEAGIDAAADFARDVVIQGDHFEAGRVARKGLALHRDLRRVLDPDRNHEFGGVHQAATPAGDQEQGAESRHQWTRNGRNCELIRS